MSGLVGVAFTFWTTLAEPQNTKLKHGLWITTIACFFLASLRVWVNERKEVERLRLETNKEINQIIREFAEIKLSLLTSRSDYQVSQELQRLKLFLHKHSFLLNRSDLREFYMKWILPQGLPLQFGAPITLTQTLWQELREQLAQIDLQSQPPAQEAITSPTA